MLIKLLFFIVLVFFILAFMWEYKDYSRLQKRPSISSLPQQRRNRELAFYGCFNYENRVEWRMIFIGSVLSTVCIWYVLKYVANVQVQHNIMILIGFIIMGIFYILSAFKQFHLFRVMCSKIKPNLTIL